jgi:FG-GAP-like repeat
MHTLLSGPADSIIIQRMDISDFNTSLTTNSSSEVFITFVTTVVAPWSVIRSGDYNGDGMSDLLWTDGNGNYAIWEMNGTQAINPKATFVAVVASPWSVIGTGDYNGDGMSDLLWTDGNGNYAIWEMNGTTLLNPNATYVANVPTNWMVQLPLGE